MKQLLPPPDSLSSLAKLVKTINYFCKLRFPRYPAHYFPIFVVLKAILVFRQQLRQKRLKLKLYPIPNKLFDHLVTQQIIQTEHTLFINPVVFDAFVPDDGEQVHFLNVSVPLKATSANPILSKLLTNGKSNMSSLFQVLPLDVFPTAGAFVRENCFYNFLEKHKLDKDKKNVYVTLQPLPEQQQLPQIATKANIFLVNTPYELPTDVVDEIITKFFETPRLLYRNHTYRIDLDRVLLGHTFHAQYFHIFTHLKRLFFKCLNLESKDNNFEMYAIVAKNFTNLHQMTSINYQLPAQLWHDVAFTTSYPLGLKTHFEALRASLLPFMDLKSKSSETFATRQIHPLFLLQGPRGSGKYEVANAVAAALGTPMFVADCTEIVSSIAAQTETKLATVLAKANICEPMMICLKNFEVLGVDNEGNDDFRIVTTFQTEVSKLFATAERSYPIILVALSNNKDTNPKINSLFLEVFKFLPPSREERVDILKWMRLVLNSREEVAQKSVQRLTISPQLHPVEVDCFRLIAEKTPGFLYGDLKLLLENSVKDMKIRREPRLSMELMDRTLNEMQVNFSDSLGAPKVPRVLWSEIGGLAKIKQEIQNSIGLPLKYGHLMGKNMRRSGILLYGPPGTGKTLIAKAVATECNLSFLSVQGPELLNMYVGQSEQNVREVFDRARAAAPCVIFLDELDSLAPNRGVAGDSGGVMDRVVSQLLSEIDGMSKDSKKPIFILAATNRPDLIDPALLRPGRFEKLLYVGPCTSTEEKEAVIVAQTQKFNLTKDATARRIAELLNACDMTGADIYSICSNAWLSAVRRTVQKHKQGKGRKKDSDLTADMVVVGLDDFQLALTTKFVPSIKQSDMAYFNSLKQSFG